jgi:hypothetical protein
MHLHQENIWVTADEDLAVKTPVIVRTSERTSVSPPTVIALRVVGRTVIGTITDGTIEIGVIVEVLCQLEVVVVDILPNTGDVEVTPEALREVAVQDEADMMTYLRLAPLPLMELIIDGEVEKIIWRSPDSILHLRYTSACVCVGPKISRDEECRDGLVHATGFLKYAFFYKTSKQACIQ